MVKKIIYVILCIAVLAAGCGNKPEPVKQAEKAPHVSTEARFTEPDTIKIEDLNIGGIHWNQPMSEVIAKLGTPTKRRLGAPRGTWFTFIKNSGTIKIFSSGYQSDTSGEVMGMRITGNIKFATSKGIKIGSSYNDLIKVYGSPSAKVGNQISYRYRSSRNPKQPDHYRYLNFGLDNNNKIVSISFGFFDDSC